MRYDIMLHQISPERLRTMRDPMKAMQLCQGVCKSVPDEVSDAVFDSLKQIPGVNERDARAYLVALRMATEGWRFCPCFPTRRTQQHERIFNLVHTNVANRLAHQAVLEIKTRDCSAQTAAAARPSLSMPPTRSRGL